MEEKNEDGLIHWDGPRMFVKISKNGCGSACVYCCTDAPSERQVLFDKSRIEQTIRTVISSEVFSSGQRGTLISLCPDTEPFKSEESTSIVLGIIKHCLPTGNVIQISTKELIPDSIMSAIRSMSMYDGQVVIFTSITSLSQYEKFEPGAAPVHLRMKNFINCRNNNIRTCLYIKPFFSHIVKEQSNLINMIHEHSPDSVCVGMAYRKMDKGDYSHPTHRTYKSEGVSSQLRSFSFAISKACNDMPIFFNSTCVSAYFSGGVPQLGININGSDLCNNCGQCKDV